MIELLIIAGGFGALAFLASVFPEMLVILFGSIACIALVFAGFELLIGAAKGGP